MLDRVLKEKKLELQDTFNGKCLSFIPSQYGILTLERKNMKQEYAFCVLRFSLGVMYVVKTFHNIDD